MRGNRRWFVGILYTIWAKTSEIAVSKGPRVGKFDSTRHRVFRNKCNALFLLILQDVARLLHGNRGKLVEKRERTFWLKFNRLIRDSESMVQMYTRRAGSRQHWLIAGVASILFAWGPDAFASVMLLDETQNGIGLTVYDQVNAASASDGIDHTQLTPGALPLSASLVADTNEPDSTERARATLDVNLSDAGFFFDYAGVSGGNPNGGDGSQSMTATLYFTVTEDTEFNFNAIATGDAGSDSGTAGVVIYAKLYQSFVAEMFTTNQQSGQFARTYHTQADGSPAGANVSALSGQTSGTLVAGNYDLYISIGHASAHSALAGATFDTYAALTFGPQTLPEPTTTVLLAVGLLGVGFARKLRTH